MSDVPTLPQGQERFKTNEVCKLARVQPYMLKYWEGYFSGLEAETIGTGQRLYTKQQVELILEVSRLLSQESLTLPGARKRIEAMQEQSGKAKQKKPGSKKGAGGAKKKVPSEAPKTEIQAKDRKEVDKKASDNVKTLLATMREIQKDLEAAVAELRK